MRRPAILLFALLFLLPQAVVLSRTGNAQTSDEHGFDIGVIIDNRRLPKSDAAKADIDTLFKMLDQQMYIEHIMVFERPPIDVMCDVFGCPETIEPKSAFPPLIWQIARENASRLFVYYIGDGRLEGRGRQLLFRRADNGSDDDVLAFPVDWLHQTLDAAAPEVAILMLDASFGPRPLPCVGDDPDVIEDTLFRDRRDYQRVAGGNLPYGDHVELSATTSLEPRLCDRFDQVLEGVERPLFTKYLLRGVVDAKADLPPFGDDDGLIDLGELADYLDDKLKRAARFQWGRLQNVRAVGSRSRALASVDPRQLSPLNAEVVRRRAPPAKRGEREEAEPIDRAEEQDEKGKQPKEAPATERNTEPARAAAKILPDDPTEDCGASDRSGLCTQGLIAGTEGVLDPPSRAAPPAGVSVSAIKSLEDEPQADRPPARERTAACRWIADTIAPYASVLVQRIGGGTGGSCAWAADRSAIELGPFAQIFTPVAWRLGRSTAQNAVLCLLDCDPRAGAGQLGLSERSGAELEPATAAPTPDAALADDDSPPEPVDPRTLTAFNRQICDQMAEPVPPYIGIPRWMPGTLILSEALRIGQGCPPSLPEPSLPTPLAIALEAPIATETPAPSPDRRPVTIVDDDKLEDWPPHEAGINTPPTEGEMLPLESATSSARGGETLTEGDVSPPEIGGDLGTADATPLADAEPEPETERQVEAPFVPDISRVRWLQSALTVDNRNPGPIDGVMGRKTEEAVQSWRKDNDRTDRVGALTEVEFQEIIRAFGERFDQIEDRVRAF